MPNPPDANIQVVNLKSSWKPFQVAPQPASFSTYTGEDTRSTFEWWNHWPVSLIDSSGRCAVAADRASSASLSHIQWPEYIKGEDAITKIHMDGLTNRPAAELAILAKSWLRPAAIEINGEGFESKGYDPTERAFVVVRNSGASPQLELKLQASNNSPLFDPAILVKNWNADAARVTVDGRALPAGTVRIGTKRNLDGTDLVVFVQQQTMKPMEITLTVPKSSTQSP